MKRLVKGASFPEAGGWAVSIGSDIKEWAVKQSRKSYSLSVRAQEL